MCGIKNRQKNYKEFTDFITNFDKIGLTETKTNDPDIILISGYVTFAKKKTSKKRPKKNDKRSRGIHVAVKDNIVKFVKIIRTDCKCFSYYSI